MLEAIAGSPACDRVRFNTFDRRCRCLLRGFRAITARPNPMRRRTASQCSPRAAAAGAPSRSPYGTRGDVSWLSTRVRVEGVFCTLRVYGVLRNSRGLSPLALGAWRTGVLTKSLPVQGSCSGEIVIDNAGSWASTRSASTRSWPVRPRGRRLASPEQSRRRVREQLHRNVGFIRRIFMHAAHMLWSSPGPYGL